MKNLLIIAILFCSIVLNAQDESENTKATSNSQNELKINTTNLIIFNFADVTYERLLNEESSVGLSILFNLGTTDDFDIEDYRTFSATAFYRHFFSRKYAKGFFVEGFGMLNKSKEENYNYTSISGISSYQEEDFTGFAFGVSVGGKFVTPRGFIAEIYLGIGRNIIESENSDTLVVGRGGISLGYRF